MSLITDSAYEKCVNIVYKMCYISVRDYVNNIIYDDYKQYSDYNKDKYVANFILINFGDTIVADATFKSTVKALGTSSEMLLNNVIYDASPLIVDDVDQELHI